MGIFRRTKQAPVTVDDHGITRELNGGVEHVAWPDLNLIEIHTTAAGPTADDVFWVFHASNGSGVVVPSSVAPDDLLARVQQLPGFNNEVLIQAMGSTDDAAFECWRKQP